MIVTSPDRLVNGLSTPSTAGSVYSRINDSNESDARSVALRCRYELSQSSRRRPMLALIGRCGDRLPVWYAAAASQGRTTVGRSGDPDVRFDTRTTARTVVRVGSRSQATAVESGRPPA